ADAFACQDVVNGGRDVLVFATDQSWAHFDDRDLGAKASEHLPKLQPDIAAADNQEMAWDGIEIHQGAVRQIRNAIEAWHRRYDGSSADVDENAVGAQDQVANGDIMGRSKAGR